MKKGNEKVYRRLGRKKRPEGQKMVVYFASKPTKMYVVTREEEMRSTKSMMTEDKVPFFFS